MKRRHTIVIYDNETGEKICDFEGNIQNYKLSVKHDVMQAIGNTSFAEHIGNMADFTLDARVFLASHESDREEVTEKICKHEWEEYFGLEEKYDVCKHCGIKNE